jgi:hypothetical protein
MWPFAFSQLVWSQIGHYGLKSESEEKKLPTLTTQE